MAHVEVRPRLVEQENARLLGEPAGQGRELALARGERLQGPPRQRLDAGHGEGGGDGRMGVAGQGTERAAVRATAHGAPVLTGQAAGRIFLLLHAGRTGAGRARGEAPRDGRTGEGDGGRGTPPRADGRGAPPRPGRPGPRPPASPLPPPATTTPAA